MLRNPILPTLIMAVLSPLKSFLESVLKINPHFLTNFLNPNLADLLNINIVRKVFISKSKGSISRPNHIRINAFQNPIIYCPERIINSKLLNFLEERVSTGLFVDVGFIPY
ncbi:hypothetical protein ACOME3_009746 [Neoechinorhynchus agilis]